jgi:hypothetical protein
VWVLSYLLSQSVLAEHVDYEGLLIAATSDANLIALHAKSRKLLWERATADWTRG